MALAVRSFSSTNNGIRANETVPVPSGAAADDVAIVSISRWQNPTSNPAITAPANFTQFATANTPDNELKVHLFWKRLTSSETGSWSFTWTGTQWTDATAHLVTGAIKTGSPIVASNASSASTSAVASTSVTTIDDDSLLLWIVNNDTDSTVTPPSGFTETRDLPYHHSAYRIAGAAGTHAASGGTLSVATDHIAMLVAISPEPEVSSPTASGSVTLGSSAVILPTGRKGSSASKVLGAQTGIVLSGTKHVARTVRLSAAALLDALGHKSSAGATTLRATALLVPTGTAGAPMSAREWAGVLGGTAIPDVYGGTADVPTYGGALGTYSYSGTAEQDTYGGYIREVE